MFAACACIVRARARVIYLDAAPCFFGLFQIPLKGLLVILARVIMCLPGPVLFPTLSGAENLTV